MSLLSVDEWYNARKGQSLLVPGADPADRGQCMQAADYALNEIYGQPYVWANAIDCWTRFNEFPQLANNFTQVSDGTVKKGDFVIFNQKVGSVYGHIDLAMQDGSYSGFQGADSNWGGNKTVHLVQHTNPSYILGTLRPKQGDNMATNEQIYQWISLFHQEAYGKPPTDQVFNDWRPVLKNNFTDGSLSIMIGTDTNAGALKNQPHTPSNFVPYSGKPLYTEK